MRVSTSVRVTGPLAPFVEGFAKKLMDQGYTDLSVRNQLRLMAHLSRWLDKEGLALTSLSQKQVYRFLAVRRNTYTGLLSEHGLQPLLDHLHESGMVPREPSKPALVREGLLGRYERYLVEERAVLPARRDQYLLVADEFLKERTASKLTAAAVTQFLAPHSRRPRFAARLTPLRSLLRFLFIDGTTSTNLVYAVPTTPGWRQRGLPRSLEPAQLQRVLATCDRRTLVGRRDYAALLLMTRLGLRAGEVAALSLDDFDWRAGEVVVHGKGKTAGRLPLPVDVGQAVVAYLHHRSHRESGRAAFLYVRAPYQAVKAGSISALATKALRAAGISSGAAHRLRHTAATMMLRSGASLTEISQVLRHRCISTTSIYAKVDHERLRTVAQPWPVQDVFDGAKLSLLAQPWPGGGE